MSMVLNLLWKDIRRFRWWLIVWFALLGIILAFKMTIIMAPVSLTTIMPVISLFKMPFSVLLCILIIRVVQEDSLTGSTAFCLTRPIKRWNLLLAKACFIFPLLLSLYAVAALVTTPDKLLFNAIVLNEFVVIFWIVALCTSRLSTALLVSIIISFVYCIMYMLLIVFLPALEAGFQLTSSIDYSEVITINSFQLGFSRVLIQSLAVTIFGAAIIVYHYLGRWTTRTVIMNGIALILVLVWCSRCHTIIFPSLTSKLATRISSDVGTKEAFTKRDNHDKYTEAMAELNKAKTEQERFYALNRAAKASFNEGKKEDAGKYAEELKALMVKYTNDWNYGNAVQDVNIVLGRIALSEGKIEEAKNYLLEAGKSPGSPQMDSFGPNMSLAQDLLKIGQKETVLEYFRLCARFWKMDHGKLNQWADQVEKGKIPDFGANLVY